MSECSSMPQQCCSLTTTTTTSCLKFEQKKKSFSRGELKGKQVIGQGYIQSFQYHTLECEKVKTVQVKDKTKAAYR